MVTDDMMTDVMAGDMAGAGAAEVSGQAFAPASAKSVPATLRRVDDTLILADMNGAERLRAPLLSARPSAPLGQTRRQVRFADGTLFETADARALEGLLPSRRPARWLHGAEAFRLRLVAVAALALASVYALYRLVLPVAVAVAIAATPESLRRAADRSGARPRERRPISAYGAGHR